MTWEGAIPALIWTARITAGAVVILLAAGVIRWLNREPWER